MISINNYEYEKKLIDNGITLIAGVDEVGRGPLVGPVVVAAVILPVNYKLEGLTDSKKLTIHYDDNIYDDIIITVYYQTNTSNWTEPDEVWD